LPHVLVLRSPATVDFLSCAHPFGFLRLG
jgi:hypothetical protein